MNYSKASGQKKVAVGKRQPLQRGFKQESMYGFFFVRPEISKKKIRGRCSREVAVSGGSTIVKNGELNVYKATT